jgi:MFS family permease
MPFPIFSGLHPSGSHYGRKQGDDKVTDNIEPGTRAQVSALYITISSLVGMGLGPMLVGLLNDYLFHDPLAIRYSLSIVMVLPGPLMFWLFTRARGPYRALRAEQ